MSSMGKKISGPRKVVPSSRPRDEGMYWGYKVRYAPNISSVFKNCPYQVLFLFQSPFDLSRELDWLNFVLSSLTGRIWSSDWHLWTWFSYQFFGTHSTIIQAPSDRLWWTCGAGGMRWRRCSFEGIFQLWDQFFYPHSQFRWIGKTNGSVWF